MSAVRAGLVAVATTGVLATVAPTAVAAPGDDGGPRVVGGAADSGYRVVAEDPGSSGSSNAGGGGGGAPAPAEPASAGDSVKDDVDFNGAPVVPGARGGCMPAPGGSARGGCMPAPGGSARPTVTPAELAQRAAARLPLPAPEIRTAPPHRGQRMDGLVGLPQWFWLDQDQGPVSERVQAGGVWAEATARPQRLIIETGTGVTISCPGLGIPYQRGMAPTASDCSYTYRQSSAPQLGDAYRVTVTVVWGGSWRGSGGAGGELPTLSRSTTIPLRIGEAQALVTSTS